MTSRRTIAFELLPVAVLALTGLRALSRPSFGGRIEGEGLARVQAHALRR